MSLWDHYVHEVGPGVEEMWSAPAAARPLYILGRGFDPRMLVGLRRALDSGSLAKPMVLSLGLAGPGGTSDRARQAEQNMTELEEMVASHDLDHEPIAFPEVHERRSLSRPLLGAVRDSERFRSSDQVIVDISSLPVGVYFGLIKGLLDIFKAETRTAELQVVVAENPELDSLIKGSGAETPSTILGFAFGSELTQSSERPPLIWAPLLGEGATAQLVALQERLRPDEICPVLPFPARDPRHADDLLIDARELLVDRFEVESTNYIYADERNPFDLYRALGQLNERYVGALSPLGRATVAVSVHASKSLSLGALLAAYEHSLPAYNAEPEHYDFDIEAVGPELVARSELSGAWLLGMPRR
jgi:hypothetical protein